MHIAFDLDGTISDPAVGITASINYALDKMGYPIQDPASLNKYIGPPLQDTFGELLNTDTATTLRTAITFFRERYIRIGYSENVLYPGITEMLHSLKQNGHTLYIATSKRTDIARAVTDYFEVTALFEAVMGCGLNRKKASLLREIREKTSNAPLIMIGDRSHDMIAGKAAGCTCIGVLWGYGNPAELLDTGADRLAGMPEELIGYINAQM